MKNLFLMLTFCLFPLTSLANDSTAMLEAGGITLRSTKDIEISSEDLYLSTKEIRVNYVFTNISDKDITTIVAFPLPDLDLERFSEEPIDLNHSPAAGFLNFSVVVNGLPVVYKQEVKAILKVSKADITDHPVLKTLSWQDNDKKLFDQMARLTPDNKAQLIKLNAIENHGDDSHPFWVPKWTVKTTYYWEQKFPAKQTTSIAHKYQPIVGGTYFGAYTLTDKTITEKYCVDDATKQGLEKLASQIKTGDEFNLATVGYVLKTGANWAGPIRSFKITFDKEETQNILSTCFSGLKKTGATTFTAVHDNFTPQEDVYFLVVKRFR